MIFTTKKYSMFATVIFLQGEQAYEYLDNIDENGPKSTINKLFVYSCEDHTHIILEDVPWGRSDEVYITKQGYILSYNCSLEYIGLTRCIVRDSVKDIIYKEMKKDPILKELYDIFVWYDPMTYHTIADRLGELDCIDEEIEIREYAKRIGVAISRQFIRE